MKDGRPDLLGFFRTCGKSLSDNNHTVQWQYAEALARVIIVRPLFDGMTSMYMLWRSALASGAIRVGYGP